MPIPPRPIPVHPVHSRHHNQRSGIKPGSNMPRKSLPLQSNLNSLDWRSELNLLNEFGPKSVPVPSQNGSSKLSGLGVNMVSQKDSPNKGKSKDVENEGSRQVELRDLIEDGKGKREKRATTATTLGFDFIPNPTILTLPDTSDTNPKAQSSLLSISKSSSKPVNTINNPSIPSLEGTPNTPSLIPQSSSPEPDEEEDWEYIPSHNTGMTTEGEQDEAEENQKDYEDEDDIIILGELELDDEIDRLNTPEGDHWIKKVGKDKDSKKGKGKVKGKGEQLSYANVLSNVV